MQPNAPAQVYRDRRNDRTLRGHHWLVHRYSWVDIEKDPLAVHAEVVASLAERAPTSANERDAPMHIT